jgi:hypothetical protein
VKHYQGEGVHKDTLCDDNPSAEIQIWLLELDKGEEVHALILCLLEQCVDPSVVVVHPPQRPVDRVWVSQAGLGVLDSSNVSNEPASPDSISDDAIITPPLRGYEAPGAMVQDVAGRWVQDQGPMVVDVGFTAGDGASRPPSQDIPPPSRGRLPC